MKVSCEAGLLILKINKSLTNSSSEMSSADFAACAVNAAWNASKDSPVSYDLLNNLYRS